MVDKIKILAISDTHTYHGLMKKKVGIPNADILVHAGDVSIGGTEKEIREFLDWFGMIRTYKHKVFIAGNHDFMFETCGYYMREVVKEYAEKYKSNGDIHYLEDSGVELCGLKFWGSPYTKPFMDFAFNQEEDRLIKHWEFIPEDTDILITHGAPQGIMDYAIFTDESTGSSTLRYEIETRIKPKVHIFGHIHEGYGEKEVDGVKYVNAAVLNERYRMKNPPILFEVDLD